MSRPRVLRLRLKADALAFLAANPVEPPSVAAAASALGVAPSVAKRALDELAAEGKVVAAKQWRETIATFDARRPKGTAIWHKTSVYSLASRGSV